MIKDCGNCVYDDLPSLLPPCCNCRNIDNRKKYNFFTSESDLLPEEYDHDGCSGCKYEHMSGNIYPCNQCKQNAMGEEKEKLKDFWEPYTTPGDMEIPFNPYDDKVNHPAHYCREGAMECIDEMVLVFGKAKTAHYCLLNAWKYRYRAGDKNGLEDMKKSDWYMRKYAELTEEMKEDAKNAANWTFDLS